MLRALVLVGCGVESETASPAEVPTAVSAPWVAPAGEGSDRIGAPAPALEIDAWIGDGPASIAALRGHVVVVRFWTDTCPYCKATAPALVELDRDFRDRGLVVLGIHHPKPRPAADAPFDAPAERRRIGAVARRYGFRFPIGLDARWRTIDTWWPAAAPRAATSATFVVDAQGIVRWVHPGPEFHPGGPPDHGQCRADYAALRDVVTALLDEAAAVTAVTR